MLIGPAMVIGMDSLQVLPDADVMDSVSTPGERLSVKLAVTPVKVWVVPPVTYTFHGEPVPPGVIVITSLAKQVAGDTTV